MSSARLFADGMIGTISGDTVAPDAGPGPAAGGDLFGRFVSVYQSNETLFAVLESVRQKIARAHAYLETPGSNPVLARAHIRQLKARRSAALTMLRANRIQARALLAQTETPFEADVA